MDGILPSKSSTYLSPKRGQNRTVNNKENNKFSFQVGGLVRNLINLFVFKSNTLWFT